MHRGKRLLSLVQTLRSYKTTSPKHRYQMFQNSFAKILRQSRQIFYSRNKTKLYCHWKRKNQKVLDTNTYSPFCLILSSFQADTNLVEDEEQTEVGAIKPSTYNKYIHESGGYVIALAVICLFLLAEGTKVFNYWWLAVWLGDGNGSEVIEFYSNISRQVLKVAEFPKLMINTVDYVHNQYINCV